MSEKTTQKRSKPLQEGKTGMSLGASLTTAGAILLNSHTDLLNISDRNGIIFRQGNELSFLPDHMLYLESTIHDDYDAVNFNNLVFRQYQFNWNDDVKYGTTVSTFEFIVYKNFEIVGLTQLASYSDLFTDEIFDLRFLHIPATKDGLFIVDNNDPLPIKPRQQPISMDYIIGKSYDEVKLIGLLHDSAKKYWKNPNVVAKGVRNIMPMNRAIHSLGNSFYIVGTSYSFSIPELGKFDVVDSTKTIPKIDEKIPSERIIPPLPKKGDENFIIPWDAKYGLEKTLNKIEEKGRLSETWREVRDRYYKISPYPANHKHNIEEYKTKLKNGIMTYEGMTFSIRGCVNAHTNDKDITISIEWNSIKRIDDTNTPLNESTLFVNAVCQFEKSFGFRKSKKFRLIGIGDLQPQDVSTWFAEIDKGCPFESWANG